MSMMMATMAACLAAVTVNVDVGREAGVVKPVNGMGQGPIQGHADCSMFRYLKEIGTPFLRYHDVGGYYGGGRFVDIPNIFRDFDADENDPKSYDFAFTDRLVEATVANGMAPFFRLGVTIENSPKIKAYRVFPPKDYAKWARVCEHVIRHYNEGWANGYRFNIRYWEIWNEPDDAVDLVNDSQMWRAPFDEYLKLYAAASRHLKATFPGIKVGGYASCGFYGASEAKPSKRSQSFIDYFHRFLDYVKKNNLPLDFFSYHSYEEDPANLGKQIDFARAELDKRGFAQVETSLNEWHSGAWRRDRGTAAHAARQAGHLLVMQNHPVDSAMFYDARVGSSYYGGIFSPMTYKPFKTYYGFAAFNELRKLGTAVGCAVTGGDGYVLAAAARGKGKAAVMIVNTAQRPQPLALDLAGGEVLSVRITDDTWDYAACDLPQTLPGHAILLVTFRPAILPAPAPAAGAVLKGGMEEQVTWETLDRFCKTNAREVKGPVKGVIVEHPWLGQQDRNYCSKSVMDRATATGVVYLHVWAHPWSWMNDAQVRLTDRLVDVILAHFKLPKDAPVVSCGNSMGGHGALAYPQFSRQNVVAAVANCPPCDLLAHYGERPDLPRTLASAYADATDLAAALRERSPVFNVATMRDIPYFIYQGDADKAVNKQLHGDRFVAAAAKRPLRVTYRVGKGCGHCQATGADAAALESALFAPFAEGVRARPTADASARSPK